MTSKFEIQIREELIRLEKDVDLDINKQLTAARTKAVAGYTRSWLRYVKQILWPTAGMVMASLLVFAVVLGPVAPLRTHDNVVVDEQNIENLKLLKNLDFYYWLSENEAGLRG